MDEILELSKNEFNENLKNINDPPKKLFYRGGKLNINNKFIAIVGARRHSKYAELAVTKIVEELQGYDITIVSGLALGIDALAHKKALLNNINTIAVLPSGLDDASIYPATNRFLAMDILKNKGTILSEHPEKTKAIKYNFPQRNRIIAGLCDLTIAIECSEKSGTRITTRLALEYNRLVGAVPHSIFSEMGTGANDLISKGAYMIRSGKDVLDILNIKEKSKGKVIELTEDEKIIYSLLDQEKTKTEILEKTGFSANRLQVAITTLEIKGAVKEELGKIFKIK